MRAHVLTSLVIAAGAAAPALAWDPLPMPDESVSTQEDFEVMAIISEPNINPAERDHSYDWGGSAIDTHGVVLLESCWAGDYPFAGVHLTFDPGFWTEHIAALRSHIKRFVPDPEYTGLIVVDYEHWRPIWDRTVNRPGSPDPRALDYDFKDDWREFARVRYADQLAGLNAGQQEEVFRRTYEDAAREFFVRTIREIKRLRPDAKAGYFMLPMKRYQHNETPVHVIGYGDLSHPASQLNDRLRWVGDECDFLMPNIYPPRYSVPMGEPYDVHQGQTFSARNAEFIYSSVAEAVRMARGKPVYAMGSTKYWGADQFEIGGWALNEIDTEQQLEYARLAGASGVVLWHDKPNLPDDVFLPYVASTLGPIAMAYGEAHDVDVIDDLDTGGSGGFGGGGGNGSGYGGGTDDPTKDPSWDNLSPEEQEAKRREWEDSGGSGDKTAESSDDAGNDKGGSTVTVTRRSAPSTPKVTGKSPDASGSSSSGSRRVFRKTSSNTKSDNKSGAPNSDSSKTTGEKKADKDEEKPKSTRKWVYKKPSNKDD